MLRSPPPPNAAVPLRLLEGGGGAHPLRCMLRGVCCGATVWCWEGVFPSLRRASTVVLLAYISALGRVVRRVQRPPAWHRLFASRCAISTELCLTTQHHWAGGGGGGVGGLQPPPPPRRSPTAAHLLVFNPRPFPQLRKKCGKKNEQNNCEKAFKKKCKNKPQKTVQKRRGKPVPKKKNCKKNCKNCKKKNREKWLLDPCSHLRGRGTTCIH